VIRAWDEDGREPWGSFPYFHGGWQMGATAVGDLDGDGWREVVAATRDGYVFAWDVPSPADAGAAWPMFRHDARRTGDLSTEIPRQEGPPQPGEPDGGGACPDDDGAAAALLLPLLGRRRLRGR
jgi:hypothetical protein